MAWRGKPISYATEEARDPCTVSDVFSPSSKERLTGYDLGRFPNETLLDRVGRAVCTAGCLPRKELFEAWEVARRVRRRFRGGRVIDMAAGHGLLAHLMLLLDDSSPSAVAIDATLPASSAKLHESLVESWPRLAGRITFVADDLHSLPLHSTDVVVSSHACGALTDVILDRAMDTGARVAVLPCCHDVDTCDTGGLTGWVDAPLAIDLMRAARLERRVDAEHSGRDHTEESSVDGKHSRRRFARVFLAADYADDAD